MKGLSLTPIVFIVVLFALLRGLSPFEAQTLGAQIWPLVLDFLVVAGLFAGAVGFESGDPPRRGWVLVTLSQLGIFIGHGLQVAELPHQQIIIAANVAWVVSIVLWVRNFGGSVLAPAWTPRSRLTVALLVLVAVGTATTGVTLEIQAQRAAELAQRKEAWDVAYTLVSTMSDAAVFIGAVFLVRLVMPMSGGAFARPYLLLCVSAAIYLSLDLSLIVTGHASFAAFEGPLLKLAGLADGTSFAAGLAQAALLRRASV